MHINKFQPFIESCINHKTSDVSEQIINFSSKLITLCKNGTFYPYLLHAMLEKDSIAKRNTFYSHLMRYAEQKYQFSYNFDPLYQINHYKFLFDEIFNEVHKQTVTLICVENITYAMKELKNEMAKIKSACIN
jgi:hypothetical protein